MKFLKFLVTVILLLSVAAVATVWVRSNAKLNQKYDVKSGVVSASTDAAALAQGKHLAATRGCMDCHGKDLAGHTVIDSFMMGHIDAPNLTHGQGSVTASYTDQDWDRAIRHGVAPDGRGLYLMPCTDYAQLSTADMSALIGYLKSLDSVNHENAPVAPGPMARFLLTAGKMKLSAEKIDHAGVQPMEAKAGVTAEFGRYVAMSCTGCHGPNYSGGKILSGPPDWPPAANLTPDPSGHLFKWNESDFIAALRTGKRPDGTDLSPIMPRAFGQMTDIELKALWLFIKALPGATTGSR